MNWIIIANGSEARIYTADMILVKSLSHPESRYKKQALISDRPGHYQTGGSARGAYSAHTDLKDVEKDKFAKEISEELEHGRKENSYTHLTVIVPAHFHGLLEKHLTKETISLIERVIHKDYTSLTDHELETIIQAQL